MTGPILCPKTMEPDVQPHPDPVNGHEALVPPSARHEACPTAGLRLSGAAPALEEA